MRRALLAALFLVAGCSGDTVRSALGIEPASASVPNLGAVQFLAENAPPPVVWTVVETGGGTVSSAGLYTAPACPTVGTFHVQAAAGTLSAQATITVVDNVATITVSPSTATLAPGQAQQFTATQTTGCGSVSSAKMTITRVK